MKTEKTITQKITSYESACKDLKVNPKNLPIVNKLPKEEQKRIIAHYKLTVIIKALNEGWFPNWKDKNEWKYYPYFIFEGNAFLYYYCYARSLFNFGLGSPLYYKSSNLAEYAGKKFKKLYNDYMK